MCTCLRAQTHGKFMLTLHYMWNVETITASDINSHIYSIRGRWWGRWEWQRAGEHEGEEEDEGGKAIWRCKDGEYKGSSAPFDIWGCTRWYFSELWVIEILGNNKGPLFWHMNPKILKFIWNSWHRFTFLFQLFLNISLAAVWLSIQHHSFIKLLLMCRQGT